MRQGGTLCVFHILQQAACCTQPARGIFHAKANQIARAKLQIQLLARGINFELPERAAAQAAASFNEGHFCEVFRVKQLCRVSTL